MQFEHFSPQSGQISAQFSHPSPQGQTTPQSVQSPHVMQKLSAPAQSTHVPHSVHTSPTEQLEHFSLHSVQTVAQLEHPSPQAHTASTHSMRTVDVHSFVCIEQCSAGYYTFAGRAEETPCSGDLTAFFTYLELFHSIRSHTEGFQTDIFLTSCGINHRSILRK